MPESAIDPERPAAALPLALAATFVGGAAGTAGRFTLEHLLAHEPGVWPWATLAANGLACLLLGFVSAHPALRSPLRQRLLATGLCGGLSTFSALTLQTLALPLGTAVAYVAVSLAAGGLALVFGRYAALRGVRS